MDSDQIYNIDLEPRVCECCGGIEFEALWNYQRDARTRAGICRFNVHNVICPRCGFVFAAPVSKAEALIAYYSASYSAFAGQELVCVLERLQSDPKG